MTDYLEPLKIEPISKAHVRNKFSCGKPQLGLYLMQHARQNDENNISETFVAIDRKDVVRGYYTLSAVNIEFKELPTTKNLPKYPMPATRIKKFAIDKNSSGQGFGEKLLINALQRIVNTNNENEIAVKAVLIDALDENAKNFWLKYGFIELPESNLKLFLPIETIQQLFK